VGSVRLLLRRMRMRMRLEGPIKLDEQGMMWILSIINRDQLLAIALLYTNIIYLLLSTLHRSIQIILLTTTCSLLALLSSSNFPIYNQACSTFSLYSTSSSPSLVVRIEWIYLSAPSLHQFLSYKGMLSDKRKEKRKVTRKDIPRKVDLIPISLPSPISVIWKSQLKDRI